MNVSINEGVGGGVLVCHCRNGGARDSADSETIVAELRRSRIPVIEVEEICELVARKDPVLKKVAALSAVSIVACHSRAVRWLFHAGGAPLDPERVKFFNLRGAGNEEILEALRHRHSPDGAGGDAFDVPSEPLGLKSDWPPWFPVIDYDRCVNCGKCLDFCLFNVYARSAPNGVIKVANPKGCKNLCPACSRICPKTAIIFPKLKEALINGADVAEGETGSSSAVDLKEVLGDDPYAALINRNRRAKRKLLRRDRERGVTERNRCLADHQSDPGPGEEEGNESPNANGTF